MALTDLVHYVRQIFTSVSGVALTRPSPRSYTIEQGFYLLIKQRLNCSLILPGPANLLLGIGETFLGT